MKRRSFIKGIIAGAAVPALLRADDRAQPAEAPSDRAETIASDRATVVETAAGRIRGYRRDGIYTFLGVPYGEPTGGTNRFRPPTKPKPWAGIRNALQFGPVCPAFDQLLVSSEDNRSEHQEDAFLLHRGCAVRIPGEDCLRANVWTPEINGSHGRPVMVFMHGGGYESGSGHDLLAYNGENLARNHDVVVVTHNHRLNAFGYLNLEELGGARYAGSANAGLLDLVAVLEWVRDNIAAFGGDSGNVTIFGQSGGGGKVGCLMAMQAAHGLFHRAAIESGPILRALIPDYSTKLAWAVLRRLGLEKSRLHELESVPAERLVWAAEQAKRDLAAPPSSPLKLQFGTTGWGPTVDGAVLARHPFEPDAPPFSAHVPLLTGTDLHELVSGVDLPGGPVLAEPELRVRVQEAFGGRAAAIIAAYRREYPRATTFDLYATIAAAPLRRCAVLQALRKAAQGRAPAYAYIYSWRTPMLDNRPGPFHACEISFVFDNAALCDHYSGGRPEALELARQMSTAWAQFARTGNPNHPGLPHWPAYASDTRATMNFDVPCSLRLNPEGEGLRLIGGA